MRGRKPKPLKLLEMDGTRRADRHGVGYDKMPDTAQPRCPTWLGREGKAEWRRVVPKLAALGMLSTVDRGTLAQLCEAWDVFVTMRRKLSEMFRVNEIDVVYQRLCHQKSVAIATYYRIAVEFGLTPSSRARLRPGGRGVLPAAQSGDEHSKAADACGF